MTERFKSIVFLYVVGSATFFGMTFSCNLYMGIRLGRRFVFFWFHLLYYITVLDSDKNKTATTIKNNVCYLSISIHTQKQLSFPVAHPVG